MMSTCQPQKLMFIDDTGRQTFNQHLLQYIEDHNDISIKTFLQKVDEKYDIISMVDALGRTLLHHAVECNNGTITKSLIDSGCDIHAADNVGQTPFLIALQQKCMKILLILARKVSEVYIDEDIGRNWLRIILTDRECNARLAFVLFPKMKVKSGESAELANILMAEKCDLCSAIFVRNSAVTKNMLDQGSSIETKDMEGNTALHRAISLGCTENVRLLLERGVNVNAQNDNGDTALFWAIRFKHPEHVKMLLEHSADINIKDVGGETALHLAVRWKQAENVKLLLEYNANENAQNGKGLTPLHLAAHFGSTENVNLLLKRGADVDVKDKNGNCVLRLAARLGNFENVKLLLDQGVDVNVQDGKGHTALHLAARLGNFENVKLLLDHGVDVNVQDGKGHTALHLAVRFERFETAKLLLERGANVNVQNSKRRIPMNHSKFVYTTVQQQEMLKLLVDNGSDLSLLDKNSKWQMYNVLKNGPKEAVEILLNSNGIFLVRSQTQKTVVHKLVKNLNPGVYELLYTRDFDVNARDDSGRTPLHCAAQAANEVACRVLLDKGAEVNATCNDSWGIPLVYALSFIKPTSDKQCIGLLLERGANVQFVVADNRTVIDMLTAHDLPEITETILGHLALLEFRGTTIIELIRQNIAANEAYKCDYELCQNQLEKMKTEPIVGGITLFKLLTEEERKVAVYMRNEELLVKIESFQSNYHSNSYCNKQFDRRITDAIQLAKLLEQAETALYKLINSMINFNSYIVYEIVRYLDRQDLVNIINM